MGVSQIVNSPNKMYSFAQAILCPDRELSPWNISFVFGASNNPMSLDFPPQGWTWTGTGPRLWESRPRPRRWQVCRLEGSRHSRAASAAAQ
ncbi:hypothetical protein MPTK1_4g03700 [Marchantia polymorpha subsp. ruderalis]|uniref:Uncharacterized protein n=2 Tax=Marchantia polymorpha TaxID=3197 RepID=A0AAF6B5Y1_MARPO|nr:hypothetical protein MARPO_0044s0104 [Marchantia polymorpha]BBN07415.1 hypothetical protein Mp_4g03700 [Marchantia polymorpha subsp. ruderalis]|eukprot:PTQ39686.1 hypothetical protein MARPO_0044s0104 [Marchantia polymorpha]